MCSGDKYAKLRLTVENTFNEARGCYGYRRIHSEIRKSGVVVSEKVIRRIMKEEHLNVPFAKKKRYCSYVGEVSPAVENIINCFDGLVVSWTIRLGVRTYSWTIYTAKNMSAPPL